MSIKIDTEKYISDIFNISGKVAVIIGAGGYLCSEMARSLAYAGCLLALLDIISFLREMQIEF